MMCVGSPTFAEMSARALKLGTSVYSSSPSFRVTSRFSIQPPIACPAYRGPALRCWCEGHQTGRLEFTFNRDDVIVFAGDRQAGEEEGDGQSCRVRELELKILER